MQRRIKVINPLSAWGGSHVQTCINLLKGMVQAGGKASLEVPRSRVDMGDIDYRASIRWPLDRFGFSRLEPHLRRQAERRFLKDLREDDIAWIWPGVSLGVYHEVHRRGNPIVMEGINTRIASARRVLEAIHEAEGLPPPFDMSQGLPEREEEEMLSMASHFFAPSPSVERALGEEDSSFRGVIFPSSYGAWIHQGGLSERTSDGQVTVLFMGTVCIRKNAHGLLRAWAKANLTNARLVLCGHVEPYVEALCAEELALSSVEVRGQVRDVSAAYREADVFIMPSFEEGSPQVTFEAATFGLPLIASPMGGGGIAERTGAIYEIDPYSQDSMIEALNLFVNDAELRAEYGTRAYAAAPLYDWNVVGQSRLEALQEALG